MERVIHKASSHGDAHSWDIEQQLSMTPVERLRAARAIKDRTYPAEAKDVRACHRSG